MKKLLSTLCASTLAAAMAAVSVAPSVAMPSVSAPVAQPVSDTVLVQLDERDLRRLRRDGRIERRVDRMERRENRREARRVVRDLDRRGDNYYYRGYRGYRTERPGYRYYNGYYFPSSAFIAGAIITGAIANSQARASGSTHVDWCYNRYRSYRASDNTFQPNSGPRRECYSPYD